MGATLGTCFDGDGQMAPAQISHLIRPIVRGKADYTKGNCFYRPESLRGMRLVLIGIQLLIVFLHHDVGLTGFLEVP